MKIEYEVGDIVKVQDDIDAGEFAARDVRLLEYFPHEWLVEDCDNSKQGRVNERYIYPA